MSAIEDMIAAIARDAAEGVMRDTRARFVSQHTSEQLLGVPKRAFLEWLRDPGFPLPIAKRGRLRLVEIEPLVGHLRAISAAPEQEVAPETMDAADQILAEVFGPGFAPEMKEATRRETGRLQTNPRANRERSRTSATLSQDRQDSNHSA